MSNVYRQVVPVKQSEAELATSVSSMLNNSTSTPASSASSTTSSFDSYKASQYRGAEAVRGKSSTYIGSGQQTPPCSQDAAYLRKYTRCSQAPSSHLNCIVQRRSTEIHDTGNHDTEGDITSHGSGDIYLSSDESRPGYVWEGEARDPCQNFAPSEKHSLGMTHGNAILIEEPKSPPPKSKFQRITNLVRRITPKCEGLRRTFALIRGWLPHKRHKREKVPSNHTDGGATKNK